MYKRLGQSAATAETNPDHPGRDYDPDRGILSGDGADRHMEPYWPLPFPPTCRQWLWIPLLSRY